MKSHLDPLFDEPVGTGIPVPNKFPRVSQPGIRLAIIGEAPGAEEEAQGEPFVGSSGRFLSALLSKAGLVRDACFIGNVCQHRPPGNDISAFDKDGPEFKYGLEALTANLETYDPNLCLLLGKTALWAATGETNIGDWRGAFLYGIRQPFLSRKCLPSYHPAACLREYKFTPQLAYDLTKARRGAGEKWFTPPVRTLDTTQNWEQICRNLERIRDSKPPIAMDIEGYVHDMSCLSIADSPTHAFIVPLARRSGPSLWTTLQEERLWRLLGQVLSDPEIPKVLQNSLYDRFVLQYSYGLIVRGVVGDTMLHHWELYCEMPKDLGFLCTLYIENQPYYKGDRLDSNQQSFWEYCCTDSAVTFEINQRLTKLLPPASDAHYRFNVAMLNPLLYMELRGIRYAVDEVATRKTAIDDMIFGLQYELDEASGFGVLPALTAKGHTVTRSTLLCLLQEYCCYKRDPEQPKKDYETEYEQIRTTLLQPGPVNSNTLGRIGVLTGLSLNTKGKGLKTYLYDTLGLPKQWKRDPKTKDFRLSTDYEALLKLSKKTDNPTVRLALEIGLLRTRSQMLGFGADNDQRVRCGYNVVGTETARITCYKSPTGSGYNLQTVPAGDALKPEGHPLRNGLRDLFQADAGCTMFQCDLSGADGWTVAAHLAALGDPTMLDDLIAGIKPAKVLAYTIRHGPASLAQKTREEIKALITEVRKEDWDYFASKIGQHGTSYLMGPRLLAESVYVQSEGKVNMSEREMREIQRLFKIRYRVDLWHRATASRLAKKPEIVSASGHKRRFFGRTKEILGEALAHEPQNNTTYATNLAALRLWRDPENRVANNGPLFHCQTNPLRDRDCYLRVEPLHQVHDALLGQWRQEDTEWACGKLKEWFNNTLTIAGIPIVIPFEGNYGSSWGTLESKIV